MRAGKKIDSEKLMRNIAKYRAQNRGKRNVMRMSDLLAMIDISAPTYRRITDEGYAMPKTIAKIENVLQIKLTR